MISYIFFYNLQVVGNTESDGAATRRLVSIKKSGGSAPVTSYEGHHALPYTVPLKAASHAPPPPSPTSLGPELTLEVSSEHRLLEVLRANKAVNLSKRHSHETRNKAQPFPRLEDGALGIGNVATRNVRPGKSLVWEVGSLTTGLKDVDLTSTMAGLLEREVWGWLYTAFLFLEGERSGFD